jgi:anti-anti-sigma factor
MEIQTRKEKNVLVVVVKGRMDAVTAPTFEETLQDLIATGENGFLIDLSDLQYISSAGLRSFLVLAKKLKPQGGDLLFAGLQGPVDEVFKISGFYSIFKIFDSVEAALLQG